MNKYTKKLEAVEAVQWDGNASTANKFIGEQYDHLWHFESKETQNIHILTSEGSMLCKVGDWIIKEPFPIPNSGRKFYPCKADIFEKTYEPASETAKIEKRILITENSKKEVDCSCEGFTSFELLGVFRYHEQRILLDMLTDNAAINEKIEREKNA